MSRRTDTFDLARLHLSSGEGWRGDLEVGVEPLTMGGQVYEVAGGAVAARLDVSRTTAEGYALRLRFHAGLSGPCMRCLQDAEPAVEVDAREVSQPGGVEELSSPYVDGERLDVAAWARDALVLALPLRLLCRPDCAGLCGVCGADLNVAGPGHVHERAPDPRWAALRDLGTE